MIILVKTLLALLCSCFKFFSYIYSLDNINDFFFNNPFLTIMHVYIIFNLFCDISSLVLNYLFIARRLAPYSNSALPFFPFFYLRFFIIPQISS
jgi:hypothetical protein